MSSEGMNEIREKLAMFKEKGGDESSLAPLVKGLEEAMDLAEKGDRQTAISITEDLETEVLRMTGMSPKSISDFKLLMKAYVNVAENANQTPPTQLRVENDALLMAIDTIATMGAEAINLSNVTNEMRAMLVMGMVVGQELTELRHA